MSRTECKFGINCSDRNCGREHPPAGVQIFGHRFFLSSYSSRYLNLPSPPTFSSFLHFYWLTFSGMCPHQNEGGYCHNNINRICRYSHRDCKSGAKCYNTDCTFLHPNRVCKYDRDCKSKTCDRRHSTPPLCLSDANCVNVDCEFTHTVEMCEKSSDCIRASCQKRHPKTVWLHSSGLKVCC